jgi:hypothetical protein
VVVRILNRAAGLAGRRHFVGAVGDGVRRRR